MRTIRGRLLPLVTIVATICIVASGCGGGDDEPAAAETKEPTTVRAFAEYVAQLIAEADEPGDCGRLREISRRSTEEIPCPAPESLRETMDAFQVTDTTVFQFESFGVVDFEPSDADRTAMTLFQANGRWSVSRLALAVGEEPGNTGDEGIFDLKKMRIAYEKAVRTGDCERQLRLTYRPAGAARRSCADQLADTRELMRIMKADPGQRPAFAGGDADFSVYSLTAFEDKARWHFTISAIKAPIGGEDRQFVLDVIRNEPAEGTPQS